MPRTQLLEEARRAHLETDIAFFVKQRRDIRLCKEIVLLQGPDGRAPAFRQHAGLAPCQAVCEISPQVIKAFHC